MLPLMALEEAFSCFFHLVMSPSVSWFLAGLFQALLSCSRGCLPSGHAYVQSALFLYR